MPNFEFRWCIKLMNIKSSVLGFASNLREGCKVGQSSTFCRASKRAADRDQTVSPLSSFDHATYRCFQLWLVDLRICKVHPVIATNFLKEGLFCLPTLLHNLPVKSEVVDCYQLPEAVLLFQFFVAELKSLL
ncbi:hypothetical protein QYF36_022762 [Acer negundo]|nr:hypothetical protein QYF36_022762 [Acer negundo]